MEVVDLHALLDASPEGSFLNFAAFNGHSFGACSITGVSPVWEMHPDTDEFFYVLEGAMTITLLEETGVKDYKAPAGTSFVVPKTVWHKPGAPGGARFIYYTPGQSLHSDASDPRCDEHQAD